MAKISRDATAYNVTSVQARDARHSHDGPEVAPRGGKNRKRNTRRWCKGKEGREHTVELRATNWSVNTDRPVMEAACTTCGMTGWRLPAAAKAQVNPQIAQQIALADQWCSKGHLYDTVAIPSPWVAGGSYDAKACVMCGKRA